MTVYKAAVIGLTGIGAGRGEPSVFEPAGRSHAAAYHQHPRTELAAVCDIRPEALAEFNTRWGDVWPDLPGYADFREMLERHRPAIVSVATPDHLHADIVVQAAQGGARAIFCEKPIATTLADADRMIAAAARHGALLSVGHTRRWVPRYHALRDLIRSGEVGAVRHVQATLLGQRAMLFRNGTHLIDMLCFFADSDPVWVSGGLEPGFEDFDVYKGDGGHDPKTDPAAFASVHFANGARGYFNGVKSGFTGSQWDVICDEALIQVSDRGATVTRSAGHLDWSRQDFVLPYEYARVQQAGAVAELVQALDAGAGEQDLISPGREGRKTLEIMLALLRSHQENGRRVDLPLD